MPPIESAQQRFERRERLARMIKAELAAQDKSRTSLARHLGVARETLSQRLNPKLDHGNRSELTLSQIQGVADFLAIDVVVLVTTGLAA